MNKYCLIVTKFGWVALGGSHVGLKFTSLPYPSRESAVKSISGLAAGMVETESGFAGIRCRMESYFNGDVVAFPDELDFSEATDFQKMVWQNVREIPYGQVRSYGFIAARIGHPHACRAVGRAVGSNRYPIIVPCHRVIAGNGGIGGFSGGIELKRSLLLMEYCSKFGGV